MKDNLFGIMQKIILALLGVFVISCAVSEFSIRRNKPMFPDDPRVDRSFVTGQPCDAPCWYGLRLEESTVDDIRATLLQLPFVDQSTLAEWNISTDGSELSFHFDCVYYNPPGSCGVLETENGRLRKIAMAVQYPLILRSSIDQLGIPEYYTAIPSPTEDICNLGIYWPEKNIIVVVEENTREKHCSLGWNGPIDLDLQISSLVYMELNAPDQQNPESRPWPDSAP